MLEKFRKILNEDQDPKAIEKISEKLETILMKNEEVGYIAVQKNPVLTVFPISVVVTNIRVIVCKPKNLGLSMDIVEYDWNLVVSTFIKEGILGSEFSFLTKNDNTITVDNLPKNQARRLFTFSKEMLNKITIENMEQITKIEDDFLVENQVINQDKDLDFKIFVKQEESSSEDIFIEEVNNVHEIEIIQNSLNQKSSVKLELSSLTKEELFEKLQVYKKLLDNGLILQGEYDRLKEEILKIL